MKFLGILSALFIAATAAPTQQNANQVNSVEMTGRQLEPLIDVLRVHGLGNALIVDPSITCTVSYTLALSTTGPPYTIELSTLDLSNCTYSTTP